MKGGMTFPLAFFVWETLPGGHCPHYGEAWANGGILADMDQVWADNHHGTCEWASLQAATVPVGA